MNLCLLCRETGPESRGGPARATCDLAASLAEEGHEVLLITDSPGTRAADLGKASISVLEVPGAPLAWAAAPPETARHNLMYAAAAYREVRRRHSERPVDAVLAPLWRSEGAVCVLDQRFPTIVTCMTSLRTLSEVDPAYPALADFHMRLGLEREALRRSRYLHGLTEVVVEKTVADYDLDPEVRAVIGRGVRDRGWSGPPPGGEGRVLEVLFVGRIEPRKGVDVLLAATEQLVGEGHEIRLTVAGRPARGPLEEAFTDRAKERPELARAVHFAGNVDDGEVDRLFAAADVVCAPSRYESHGIVLLEAMMHGRPLVTCAAGGIGEVVEPGVNSLVAPPEDPSALAEQLRAMLVAPDLRARLGSGGREAYERRFDARVVARRMAGFIEEVAAGHDHEIPAEDAIRARLAELLRDAALAQKPDASALAGELLVGRAGGVPGSSAGNRPPPAALDERTIHTRAALREAALADEPALREGEGSRQPSISAILMTRDRPEFLRRALDSLEEQGLTIATLVLDQGSAPDIARAVAAECDARPDVVLHRVEQNLGIAAGRNLGVELTDGELVLFLDDDAELLPGSLAHMVDLLDGDGTAGAVTATVVTPDGLISHSGGSLDCGEGVAAFSLGQFGEPFATSERAPSGTTGWIGGTAFLVRRTLLEEIPFDAGMKAYFDDNEWSYRVALKRPGCLRRSREALALHYLAGRQAGAPQSPDARYIVSRLAACAHFYARHGLLLGPFAWELLPDRVAADGDIGLGDVRLLMELIAAKGEDWTLEAWETGGLENLLQANKRREEVERTRPELEVLRPEVPRLNELVYDQQQTMSWLFEREATLRRIEAGGWWRMRTRLLALERGARRLGSLARARRSR